MQNKIYSYFKFIFILTIFSSSFINSHKKGDSLREATHKNQNNVITFTASTYKDFVLKHPRPYDVVILYTLKMNCNFCDTIKEEYFKVAESYYDNKALIPDKANNKRAVFFGVLYYSEDAKEIFKALKLPAQTTIMYTTPHNILVNDNNEAYIKYDEENIIPYKERRDFVLAHKIIEFINAKSRRSIDVNKNPFLFLFYFIVFCLILYLGVFLYQHFKFLLLSPYVWTIGSLAIFIICIGGIVYNILHGAAFFKYDREGNIIEYIHTGQRAQYAGEGLLLSGMFVLIGSLMFLMTCINRIPGHLNHKLSFILICVLIVFLSKSLTTIYRIKASWYRPEFNPPSNYIKGSLLMDQGIAF